MPAHPDTPRLKGISLPPSGWVLAVLLFVYLFVGLIGHDPWKHDDAVSIGIAFDVANGGHWLTPQLAGRVFPDAPLYYWVSALSAQAFSWLLPFHDGARLATALFTLLALEFILLAARELHGREYAAAAPLVMAGSIGFLYHAHEAQPMLAALMAHTAAYWALILMRRRPYPAAAIFGGALALAFLANGLLPVFTLLPLCIYAFAAAENKTKAGLLLLVGIAFAVLLSAGWLLPLRLQEPVYFAELFRLEWASLLDVARPAVNTLDYLNMLLWYAWPALPLAAWALWSKRRLLLSRPLGLPIASFCAVLLILGVAVETRSSVALLLLPPLVLLAVPGVASLRRGAANAFDWFGMMTFTLFAVVVWIGWSAMVFGWPSRLAAQAVRLEPGFVGNFKLLPALFAVLATVTWFWLIATSPRSPMRGIMHWMAGLTLFWLLIANLWMPWIDYGKSYRPLAASLARVLPTNADCIAHLNVPDSILASLDYFDGIRTQHYRGDAGSRCHWLLLQGTIRDPATIAAGGWKKAWEGKRPADRHESDKFQLFRRNPKAKRAVQPSDFVAEEEGNGEGIAAGSPEK